MNDDKKNLLLDILALDLLRIRAFANSGDVKAFSVEADHLHNLPALIQSFRSELLNFYLDVEKPEFVSRGPKGVEQFYPLWDRLSIMTRRGNGR